MTDNYLYIIVALLPLSACMVVLQVNPYHALVVRGILGAVAALVYAVFGGADVALTEALVGTMLAITLYAVAVRSSMLMRLGVLANEEADADSSPSQNRHLQALLNDLRTMLSRHYMRLEIVTYPDAHTLQQALQQKEVHSICTPIPPESVNDTEAPPHYQTLTRVQRLHTLMQDELPPSTMQLSYVPHPANREAH